MTLLFIENRYKTYFFEPIAQKLKSQGHQIHWLIQNKQFSPSGDATKHVIRYPKQKFDYEKIDHVERVIFSDRQVNHFYKKDNSHFYYYNKEIEGLLQKIEPHVVFGESTAFHELLAIENCKKQNILYLHPSSCRYPVGRFSFYKYDTLDPFSGSNEALDQDKAKRIIDDIVNRNTAPNYMAPTKVSKTTIVADKIKKVYAYYRGEKYNTPNPFIKYKLEGKKKSHISLWNENALQHVKETNALKVLYPLQLQPEANIDVWGRPHRDQTKLIEDISNALPEGAVLYVKPNPKSKYELQEKLINLVQNKSNIEALHQSTKMGDILPLMDIVITVTGTIAIECVLSNKPVATLVKTINNKANNCKFIDNIEQSLPKILETVVKGDFPKLTENEKIDYINLLNKSSFKGIVSDPLSDVNCLNNQNIDNLLLGFSNILKAID